MHGCCSGGRSCPDQLTLAFLGVTSEPAALLAQVAERRLLAQVAERRLPADRGPQQPVVVNLGPALPFLLLTIAGIGVRGRSV